MARNDLVAWEIKNESTFALYISLHRLLSKYLKVTCIDADTVLLYKGWSNSFWDRGVITGISVSFGWWSRWPMKSDYSRRPFTSTKLSCIPNSTVLRGSRSTEKKMKKKKKKGIVQGSFRPSQKSAFLNILLPYCICCQQFLRLQEVRLALWVIWRLVLLPLSSQRLWWVDCWGVSSWESALGISGFGSQQLKNTSNVGWRSCGMTHMQIALNYGLI